MNNIQEIDVLLKSRIGQLQISIWITHKWNLGKKMSSEEVDYINKKIAERYGDNTYSVRAGRKYLIVEKNDGMPNRMIAHGSEYNPSWDSRFDSYDDKWKEQAQNSDGDRDDCETEDEFWEHEI